MLVLDRKVQESIKIGKNYEIEIVLLRMKGQKASIGIKAPKDIPIDRTEISNKKNNKEKAAKRKKK